MKLIISAAVGAFGLALFIYLENEKLVLKPELNLEAKAALVLEKRCSRCHDSNAGGSFDFIWNMEQLHFKSLVIPGNPEKSKLMVRIYDGTMPRSILNRITTEEISILEEWIRSGAPPLKMPNAEVAPFMRASPEEVAKILTADHPSPTEVYISFHDSIVGNREKAQLALEKILNSLSWEAKIVKARVISDAFSIYAVDLKLLGWTLSDWEKWTFNAKKVGVAVSGDWLTINFLQAPLYYEILLHGKTLQDLFKTLKVKVPADAPNKKVLSFGIKNSFIANGPRVIQRHSASIGSLWLVYDADSGGEGLFDLPNGLQGFFAFDKKYIIKEQGNLEVLKESPEAVFGFKVGMSCFSCHREGLNLVPEAPADAKIVIDRERQSISEKLKEIGDNMDAAVGFVTAVHVASKKSAKDPR